MQIAIILLAVCVMLAAMYCWILAGRIDELTEIIGNMAIAVAQTQDDIKQLRELYAGAEELIGAAKEAADEQVKLEREFQEGLKNIVNY